MGHPGSREICRSVRVAFAAGIDQIGLHNWRIRGIGLGDVMYPMTVNTYGRKYRNLSFLLPVKSAGHAMKVSQIGLEHPG